MPFFSKLNTFCLSGLFFLIGLSSLDAHSLRDWLEDFQKGDQLAYRSANTVGIVKLVNLHPVQWQQTQVEASTFFASTDWIRLLQDSTTSPNEANPSSGELWQVLLDLPLERVVSPRSWRPKLALLADIKGPIEWSVWQVHLPPLLSLPPTIRLLTLYVASGPALEAAGLPSPWPYWIENHDTLHKWASYLVKSHRPRGH